MTKTTGGFVVAAIGLALTMGPARGAAADPVKCKEAIAKQSATYVQKRTKALQKCEEAKTKGKLPAAQVCTGEPKTQKVLGVLATKLGLGIAGACGGADKTCGNGDDDSLVSIGWGALPSCPDFGASGCTQAIANCADIASCIQCSADAAVAQAIALYYASLDPGAFASGSAINKCQQAIGKATAKFLAAKSKALQKCRNAQLVAGTSNPCPDGATGTVIGLAEQKKVTAICKACGGPDKLCGGPDDLMPPMIGFAPICPDVTPPGAASCTGAVGTMSDLVACVDCVTEAAVDCIDALAVPEFVSPLPAECNPTTTTTTSTTIASSTTTTTTTSTTATTTTVASSTTTTTLGAVCGNGVREPGEQCDDGNTTNLDGCDATCLFEQNQRVNSLSMVFATDTTCTQNVLGASTFASTVQSQIASGLAAGVADGSTSILLRMLSLEDLTGTTDAAVGVGVLSGSPVAGAGYDGTNDVDWWYTADPTTIDANRNPLAIMPGSIVAKTLATGFGTATIGLNLFGGGVAPITMFRLVVRSTNGATSTPAVSSGTPPGHLGSEQLDPALVSYQTSASGSLCGKMSAASLAAIPVPVPFTTGTSACTQGYSVGTNSLLDVVVGGCTVFIIPAVHATQPDAFDPAAPVLGAGPPYKLAVNALRQVTTCTDNTNAPVNLAACLQASGYSSYLHFTSDRVIIK
jgi:cysteine-rich repeat protein